MDRWFHSLSDSTILLSAVLLAAGVVLIRIKKLFHWFKIRIQHFLSRLMRDSVREEIEQNDQTGVIVESISRMELEVGNLSSQHIELSEKVDKLSSDVAVSRELGKERGDHAEARLASFERSLTTLFEAALHVAPPPSSFYIPKDVTER